MYQNPYISMALAMLWETQARYLKFSVTKVTQCCTGSHLTGGSDFNHDTTNVVRELQKMVLMANEVFKRDL